MKILSRIILFLLTLSIFGEFEYGFNLTNSFIEYSGCNETPSPNSDMTDSPFCFDTQPEDHPFDLPDNLTRQKASSYLHYYNSFMPQTSDFACSVWQPPKSC